jgi:hypothetical protein
VSLVVVVVLTESRYGGLQGTASRGVCGTSRKPFSGATQSRAVNMAAVNFPPSQVETTITEEKRPENNESK